MLHSFTRFKPLGNSTFYTNSDGAFPYSGLVLLGNTLYGTTTQGGSGGVGTVFSVNTDGTGFTGAPQLRRSVETVWVIGLTQMEVSHK